MTLEQIEKLIGYPTGDPNKDLELQLYLDAALEAARVYADKLEWPLTDFPSPLVLGIKLWIETMMQAKETKGIQSESIGGMSQTFIQNMSDSALFADVYKLWDLYHTNETKSAVFRPAVRRFKA